MKQKIEEFLEKLLYLNMSFDIVNNFINICLIRVFLSSMVGSIELTVFAIKDSNLLSFYYSRSYCDYIEGTKDIILYNHYLELQILFVKFELYKK
jgi:hypothetical protein